jgi:hypothetical protein
VNKLELSEIKTGFLFAVEREKPGETRKITAIKEPGALIQLRF